MPWHKRAFDIVFSSLALLLLSPLIVATAVAVKLTSKGPVLYISERVGRGNQLFAMPKFRSMKADTPVVATHLLSHANRYLTPIGSFLRRSSLDELPQLFCILKGDMSFVGPRPALYNQNDLISARTELGIEQLVPGLTGWAQVNGRDDLPIPIKVNFDRQYLENRSFALDLKIIWLTLVRVIQSDGVAH